MNYNLKNRIEKILYQWALSGKLQQIEYIEKLMIKGYIWYDVEYYEDYKEQLIKIISVLNTVHKDLWTFFVNIYNGTLYINILYPSIVINDDFGNQTIVHNFVVYLKVKFYNNEENINQISFQNLEGKLYNPTAAQFVKGYRHSHLPINTSIDFVKEDTFCLGYDTDIANFLATQETFSEDTFELLLHLINGVVEYESEAGTPYIRLKTIPCIKNLIEYDTNIEDYNKEIHNQTVDNYFRRNFSFSEFKDCISSNKTFSLQDNRLILNKTDQILTAIKQKIISQNNFCEGILLTNVGSNVFTHKINANNRVPGYFTKLKQIIEELNIVFVCKDREIPFAVLEKESDMLMQIDIFDSYLNPKVEEYIFTLLSNYYTNKFIYEKIRNSNEA